MGFGKGIADFEGISAPLITLGFGLLLWFGTGAAWFLEQTIYAGHPPSFFGVVVDLATVATTTGRGVRVDGRTPKRFGEQGRREVSRPSGRAPRALRVRRMPRAQLRAG